MNDSPASPRNRSKGRKSRRGGSAPDVKKGRLKVHDPVESTEIPRGLDRLDRRISDFMRNWGITALRFSLAVIFVWFGILKPLGLSPAASLVRATVDWLPLLSTDAWVSIIGWWEVAIGLTFLHRRTIRIAIALLVIQMAGTLLPLVILPEVTFQPGRVPYAPTLEGQYIIKNLLIISAALVIGGTVRKDARRSC